VPGERFKDLLARQAKLNAALDLNKDEKQVALPAENDIGLSGDIPKGPSIPPRVQRNYPPGMSPYFPSPKRLIRSTDSACRVKTI
jgi:hypothetical protein